MKLNVRYEDNHLLIVDKPVNIPVQADASKDLDLLTMAKTYIKEKYNKPGQVYLGLVHRLDRPVGGAIVFARTSKAASRLADQLRRHKIDRKYLAICRGHLTADSGHLVDFLYKDRRKNISYVVDANHDQAKKAILSYQVIASQSDLSLVKVALETGRSHQIRLQLANQDCPLYGDQKYGQAVNQPGQQIALWAYHLSLTHPTTKERIQVTSLPDLTTNPWQQFDIASLDLT
ncbi:RNA pseudouridine synthase [Aerococcus urinaehominis]|uniref:RNA pseudouridylate synthase n=1 Tax=Aerococcus urinaehominis TaxID=128944 RepID=A0A109RHV3_9LACT|nr:RluA family pseudouridine synthase [Aerococcus urinaehominis]AMB99461.1 RNA pseudouridine synthase [Aerococcus urinaehominis]SDM28128.1 23S rRNA pseudouridine1911/1915/1917 synthase [Aerococcus urinaehominis]